MSEATSGEKLRNEKRKAGAIARRMPSNIPEDHRTTDDTRIMWLWNQRLIVVQNIYLKTSNIRDRMACALVLGAAYQANLASIELVFKRLEGGSQEDTKVVEDDSTLIL
ncbi:hypothetical protein SEA_UNPHAZED_54 [Microbacterium phage Unphazed]|uniref:Uncharacterized protein n=4 Tax=Tinytimothyvirus alex44 TaxID=2845588 RepID=A0A4Y6EMN4_9CAUD|nr:hypothetical protein HWC34_gp55 [Microbacterium phage Alex44]AZV01816.1 hypothetical protein SEA_ARMAWEN_54 [Microbacterium phage ArMaWen]QDF16084.1 hypothetical protein SEA_LILYLOU_56 [Microbacterium phage LilyLou]QJD52798.1 hypothetical protein SEA_UNPHAZED_54 [Microbacterium phage Unphazed]QJD52851.1 hypothetical protein SEA_PHOGO_54 [Microbacterium phage Phogo]QPX62697.1 hypothetical protein SEA_XITLALLI_52 [Microbacterium phage Xitlalli]QRI44963.1 hypothetical protein SEA_BLUERUGRAT_5